MNTISRITRFPFVNPLLPVFSTSAFLLPSADDTLPTAGQFLSSFATKTGQARLNTQFFFPYLNCIAEISRKRSAQYTLKTYLSEKFLRRRIK